MDVTQLALTWVERPNGEKLASTWVQIWSRPKWAQVIASQRKCAQALAKRSRKLTQVFNLRQLASPFDQALKPKALVKRTKLNLGRDLCWVAKWTHKFPRKYTQVAKKNILRQTIL